ncbi:type II toxin-antitoxin system RelE/ParE family toxin [Chitinibacteraceae bacterium HSL-7]
MACAIDEEGQDIRSALDSVEANQRSSARGMDVLFRRYAEGGRTRLTAELFHEVDAEEDIYEFIKGRLRVLCFVAPDDGSLLILSHHFVKKTQKTPRSEVHHAVQLKQRYLAAQNNNTLQIDRTNAP